MRLILTEKGVKPTIVDYLSNPLTEEEITILLTKLEYKHQNSFERRRKFINPNLKKKNDPKNVDKAMAKYPRLIERPIVIDGDKALLCAQQKHEAFLK